MYRNDFSEERRTSRRELAPGPSQRPRPRRRRRRRRPVRDHMAALGFTNRLAVYLVIMLILGLAGGFALAVWSIREKYTGSLLCWTVVFTPIGTALSVVLARIVDKNRDENTSADGEGIKYATAKAQQFQTVESVDSPPI